jgi:hypothetical protein
LAQFGELLYLIAFTSTSGEPTWSSPYTDPDPLNLGTHNAYAIASTTAAQSTSVSASGTYITLTLATFLPLQPSAPPLVRSQAVNRAAAFHHDDRSWYRHRSGLWVN